MLLLCNWLHTCMYSRWAQFWVKSQHLSSATSLSSHYRVHWRNRELSDTSFEIRKPCWYFNCQTQAQDFRIVTFPIKTLLQESLLLSCTLNSICTSPECPSEAWTVFQLILWWFWPAKLALTVLGEQENWWMVAVGSRMSLCSRWKFNKKQ